MSSTATPWYKAARAAVEGRRCTHCKKNKAQAWSRGMCRKCYLDPAARALVVPLADGSPLSGARPAAATAHPPGSPEKVAVMEDRVRRGEQPFHPADASWDVDRPAVAPPFWPKKQPYAYSRATQEVVPPSPRGFRHDPRALTLARLLVASGPLPLGKLVAASGFTRRAAHRLLYKSARRPDAIYGCLFVCEHAAPENLWRATLGAAELVLDLDAEGGER